MRVAHWENVLMKINGNCKFDFVAYGYWKEAIYYAAYISATILSGLMSAWDCFPGMVFSLFDLDLSQTLSIQGLYRDSLDSDTLWLSSHSLRNTQCCWQIESSLPYIIMHWWFNFFGWMCDHGAYPQFRFECSTRWWFIHARLGCQSRSQLPILIQAFQPERKIFFNCNTLSFTYQAPPKSLTDADSTIRHCSVLL
jgi:hypothetical protein